MAAKNKVITGDYVGGKVSTGFGIPSISYGFGKMIMLDKDTVEAYELVTDEHRKSAASGVGRGLIGGALLGPVGLLAGGLSAKSKGVFTVAINFKDGKSSLLEIDDKNYKALLKKCF